MDIADILSNEGFRDKNSNKVSSSQIKHILQNILYTGKFIYSGKLYEGKYKPIISQELFDKVQTLIGCVPKKPLTKRETTDTLLVHKLRILLNDFESKSCEDICKECKGRNYDHHLDQITSISI